MSRQSLLLFLFLGCLHKSFSQIIAVGEDTEPGAVLASFSCSGTSSFKTIGGLNANFFKTIAAGSKVNLTLARRVDLENETDFSIVRKPDCLYETVLPNPKLIFTCDTVPTETQIVISPKDEFEPYLCSKNCTKLESVALKVPENTTIGTTLLEFNICDKDVNADTSSLSIKVIPGTYLTEANRDKLRLKSLLDYESEPKTKYSSVSLNGKHRLNVSITVTDSDDLGIAFDKNTFKCFVPENHPVAVTNCSVIARDLDKGLNTVVGYELLSVTPSNKGLFELLPNGSFSLKSSLDREKETTYYLAVRGFQVDRPQDKMNYTTVLLTVTDVDDNTPEMTEAYYSGSVTENSPVGTIVCQVSATDKDEGENSIFDFKIVGNDALFKVDATTGSVTVKAPIDREAIKSNTISFMIHAVSKKTPTKQSAAANVTVQVLDENDNSPKFEHQHVNITITKTQTLNTKIVQINATDPDKAENGKVSYRLEKTDSPFVINTSNGIISLKRSLSESFDPVYSLVVVANDNAVIVQSRRSSMMVVQVRVTDVNVHTPFFNNMVTTLNIPEDVAVGSTLLELKATDKDPSDTLFYSVENAKNIFTVENNYLKTLHTLDRETKPIYHIVLAVNDSLHVTQSNLTVKVTDVNDNGPVFQKLHYVFNVTEEEKNNVECSRVSATDLDDSLNGEVVYELDLGSKWAQFFSLDKTTGSLTLKAALDRESLSPDGNMSFLIFAYDRGQPERMNSTLVTVNIIDINDNAPKFDVSERNVSYTINEETTPVNFHKAEAIDPDGNSNSVVLYRLKETSLHSIIDVSKEGNVSLKRPLHFSDANGCSSSCIRFTIEAYNTQTYVADHSGRLPGNTSQTIIINIKDINNKKPVFDRSVYSKAISECMAPGTEILSVSASDADITSEYNTVFYWIEQKGYPFSIDQDSGSIFINGSIDFDPPSNQTSFTFNVYATDDLNNRNKSIRTSVTVNIQNCNDNPPIFSSGVYRCYLYENKNGSFNCSLVATDADGDNINYHFASPTLSKVFSISRSTGSMSALIPFDFEKLHTTEYEMNVTASDGHHTSSATVLVKIIDVNDERPVFHGGNYSLNIKENVKDAPYVIGEIKVTDADSNFSLSIGNCQPRCEGCFSINEKGIVSVLKEFDYESSQPNHFTCEVFANDTLTDVQKRNVFLHIIDVNDNAPSFTNSALSSTINETAAPGTLVVQLIANDRDKSRSFNKVSYSIYGGNELGLFSIDTSNGSLFTSKKLDEHFGENITLLIQACDSPPKLFTPHVEYFGIIQRIKDIHTRLHILVHLQINNPFVKGQLNLNTIDGNPSLCGYSHLTIQIKNQNIHKPMFLGEPYNVELKERNGSVSVLHVYADDKDNDKLEYRVINETKTFTFQGNVLTANSLDAEAFHNTNGVCYVKIQVSDNVHNVSTTVVVSIVDVNDNPPELIATQGNGYTVTMNDITNIGEIILSISAQDSDISNKGFTYVLDGGNGDFKINQSTGDLFLVNKLGKNGKTYNMSVVVMDHGDPPKSDSALIHVIVTDTNPEFHFKQNFMVNMSEENIQSQTSLAVVSKNGLVSHLDYEISSENKINILKVFRLEQSTGKLTLANASKPLDFEQQSKYEFTIMAKDHGVFQKIAITNVTINVIDVNEKPKIMSSEIKVFKEEHTPGNAFISRIQANDPDIRQPFNELSFSISDNVNFKIDENGTITVKANELKAGNYTLIATVTDGGQLKDSLTMQIVVPMIKEILFNVSVNENNTVPYNLNNLNTTIYGIAVTYNILHSTFSGLFKVHNNIMRLAMLNIEQGSLMLTAVIDREIVDSIEVYVHGRDISSGILLTKIKVVIHVEDINDCSPNFLLGSYSLSIDDLTHNNTVIGTIAAVDNDVKEENRNLTYELVGSGAAGLFTMDRMGNLRIHRSSLLQTKTYDLVIKVSDGQFQSETALKINVIDTNDHSPHFSLTVYSFNITEGQAVGSIVGSVQAQDADSGRNGNFTLSITAGNQNSSFKMNDMSGHIVNVKPIDREHLDKYQLLLTAQDNGNNPRQGTCTVVINVLDLNDNTPKLGASVYSASILENSKRNASVVVVPDIIASDPDLGMNGSEGFEFKLNDTTSPFCLSRDGSKASVYVCNDIDRELQDTYYLEVAVHDRNGASSSLHSSAPLTIHILDVNDEAPQFTESVYRFNVSENSGIFMSVGKIVATDKDINENKDIKFGIAKGDDGKFHIDTYSGVISVIGNIDREQKSHYDLYVVAFDGVHKTVAIVTVTVTDVNDNAPLFTMFVIDVAENRTGIIYNTSVYDKDERFTKNSKVSFSVKGRDSQGIEASNFGITADGRLNLTSPLDREKEDHYEVTIIAKDNGVPSLSSSLTLYINVLDVNDNDPVICVDGKCGVTETDIHIKYDTPAMSVVKILDSRDLDLGSNVTFSLLKSKIAELFRIEPTTGMLKILDPKSLQTTVNLNSSQLFIEVLAMDAGRRTSKTLMLRVHFD